MRRLIWVVIVLVSFSVCQWRAWAYSNAAGFLRPRSLAEKKDERPSLPTGNVPLILSRLSPAENNRTKIIATMGPATQSEDTLRRMMLSGMNVARINCSFLGDYSSTLDTIRRIRKVAGDLKRPVTILADLQGPKIRIGAISAPINIKDGETVFIIAEGAAPEIAQTGKTLPVDYPRIAHETKPGDKVLIEDGKIELRVVGVDTGRRLECEVIRGGTVEARKGVNLPDSDVSLSSLTEKDIRDLKFAVRQAGVDAIALSFVRSRQDVLGLKEQLRRLGSPNLPIVAKIETPQAVANIDEVLSEVSGIMVARGDLAVEMAVEQVPVVQRKLVGRAMEEGVPVIVATQMLDSLEHQLTATRAEVSDVNTAVHQLADATMLSGETSKGVNPVNAVRQMAVIARTEERTINYWSRSLSSRGASADEIPESITLATFDAANRLRNCKAIVVFTKSGAAARRMAQLRPGVPIIAITPEQATAGFLNMVHGVFPVLVSHEPSDIDNFREYAVFVARYIFAKQLQEGTDYFPVVLSYGEPGVSGGSDTLQAVNLADFHRARPRLEELTNTATQQAI